LIFSTKRLITNFEKNISEDTKITYFLLKTFKKIFILALHLFKSTFSFFLRMSRHFLPSYVQTVRVKRNRPGSRHWNTPDLGMKPPPSKLRTT